MSSEEAKAKQAQFGMIGLAVMGRNLARNIARHGYVTAVHNRTDAKTIIQRLRSLNSVPWRA